MDLRVLALKVADVTQDAGNRALRDQLAPRDLVAAPTPSMPQGEQVTLNVDERLIRFIENRLTYLDPFDGFWRTRPEVCEPGSRFWCVSHIDGAINFMRSMAEWTVTVSLFEFDEDGSAQPILGVVHAPALGLTYLAAKEKGAIRIRHTAAGDRREKIMPSTTGELKGSVVCYGMSYFPEESKRALDVVAAIAGKPADIKRVGPTSLDLCKVADGTYDAYFEPDLHQWDVPAVSAGAVVVCEAQGTLRQWNGDMIHWRQENDVVASNGLIIDELAPYLS
ncbi:inositol monophosphatase family protein [Bifidobacterium tibiigranuli]|jgi:myo-inositol-1(or 4)-monophosphatase|uniref:inositol monophosphatase family protein n=1 Tax=Bifidobacterium tibiigranuli TaxID=2172043 RepID=UPI0026E9D3DF|nr:inositol monophosphatase family protein [Bifidobacterium tibiigranuli]MCI1649662.1 inositol monophosphatase family protein [Bifidobacterium tibiigranuli]MCI2186528.1 inositol monophosphatase family protein [Bifidobacterium tibiigranuli]MCI2204764.1 inositol monophosphatase family protein [Bifidobacterium tibiigranuli]